MISIKGEYLSISIGVKEFGTIKGAIKTKEN
jgi:hypothetical protein